MIRLSATPVLSRLPAWRIGIIDHETAIIELFRWHVVLMLPSYWLAGWCSLCSCPFAAL